MTDGTGSLSYSYDELSRARVETRNFADTLQSASSGGYKLEYSYTLAGGIKSIKDPNATSGWEVTYATDKTGRTTSIGGSGFGSQTSFATNIAYRAFGGVKSMSYSTTSPTNITLSYNTRLKPATYESESSANTVDIQNKTYTYNPDGSIKQAADNVESKFGQLYEYDFAARLKKNQFGTGSPTPTPQYKQNLGYDAFNNLTNRQTWDKDNTERTFTAGYTNNRKTTGGYGIGTDTHDNAGNVIRNIVSYTPIDERNWKFDAAGRMADWEETSTYLGTTRWDQGAKLTFDGDGRTVKRESRRRVWASPATGWYYENEYTIFSSVTGQPIVELNQYGDRAKTNVYLGSSIIAEQIGVSSPFDFKNIDPITGSSMTTDAAGDFPPNDAGRTEVEPLGAALPIQEPEAGTPPSYGKGGAGTHNPQSGCSVDDAPVFCQQMKGVLRAGERMIGNVVITKGFHETPDGIDTPDDEDTPENEAVVRVGSTAEWGEVIYLPGDSSENQAKCDYRLARIFGGPDTVMATKWDLKGIIPASENFPERRAAGNDREATVVPVPGSEDPRAGAVHLYSNADGTAVDAPNAFTPPGWANSVADVADTGNFIRFYYKPGSLSKYGYSGGLTVNFTHIGPTDSDGNPIKPKPNGPRNAAGSVQVGVLGGGPGTDPKLTKGSNNGYWVHSHMIFNVWDGKNSPINKRTRVDPRTIFCRDFGF